MKKKIFITFSILILITSLIVLARENIKLRSMIKDSNEDKIVAIANNKTIIERKITKHSNNPRYKLNIYYPYTSYKLLNSSIKKKIKTEIDLLLDTIKEYGVRPNQYYSLFINYDKYNYKNYVSYVFYISSYTGGAHPNNTIWTISYDEDKNKIISIDNLVKKDPNILNTLSTFSKDALKKDKRFKDTNNDIKSMIEDGTKPINDNFKNFAFSEDGLIIFFEQYQVAPYSFGNFEVIIPYSKLSMI